MTLNPETVERSVPRYVQKTVSGKKGFYDSLTNQFIPEEVFELARQKEKDAGRLLVEPVGPACCTILRPGELALLGRGELIVPPLQRGFDDQIVP